MDMKRVLPILGGRKNLIKGVGEPGTHPALLVKSWTWEKGKRRLKVTTKKRQAFRTEAASGGGKRFPLSALFGGGGKKETTVLHNFQRPHPTVRAEWGNKRGRKIRPFSLSLQRKREKGGERSPHQERKGVAFPIMRRRVKKVLELGAQTLEEMLVFKGKLHVLVCKRINQGPHRERKHYPSH